MRIKINELKNNSDFEFQLESNKKSYVLRKYHGTVANVVIPSFHNSLPVTRIAMGVFSGNLNIKTVSIPDSVNYIGDSCFSGCSHLLQVRLSQNLEGIRGGTFADCTSLYYLELPISNSFYWIGNIAFRNCISLKNIPDLLSRIDAIEIYDDAFLGCVNLNTPLKNALIEKGCKI